MEDWAKRICGAIAKRLGKCGRPLLMLDQLRTPCFGPPRAQWRVTQAPGGVHNAELYHGQDTSWRIACTVFSRRARSWDDAATAERLEDRCICSSLPRASCIAIPEPEHRHQDGRACFTISRNAARPRAIRPGVAPLRSLRLAERAERTSARAFLDAERDAGADTAASNFGGYPPPLRDATLDASARGFRILGSSKTGALLAHIRPPSPIARRRRRISGLNSSVAARGVGKNPVRNYRHDAGGHSRARQTSSPCCFWHRANRWRELAESHNAPPSTWARASGLKSAGVASAITTRPFRSPRSVYRRGDQCTPGNTSLAPGAAAGCQRTQTSVPPPA